MEMRIYSSAFTSTDKKCADSDQRGEIRLLPYARYQRKLLFMGTDEEIKISGCLFTELIRFIVGLRSINFLFARSRLLQVKDLSHFSCQCGDWGTWPTSCQPEVVVGSVSDSTMGIKLRHWRRDSQVTVQTYGGLLPVPAKVVAVPAASGRGDAITRIYDMRDCQRMSCTAAA